MQNSLSQSRLSLIDEIHQRAREISKRFRNAEAELVEVLQQVEHHRVFVQKGHSSLFMYVVKELGLSESVAYNLIAVSRKACEVPELKVALTSGAITLSNARKIVPVLNPKNKIEWIKKAATLSQRQLEKEIVKIRPEMATPERVRYISSDVTETRVRLELGLSETRMLRLRRVQDLMSQSWKRDVKLEEVMTTLADEYLKRHDPLEIAKRQFVKKGFVGLQGQTQTQSQTETLKTPVAIQVESISLLGSTFAPTQVEGSAADNIAIKVEPLGEQKTEPLGEQKTKTTIAVKREPISANLLHQINLRDQRRCTFVNIQGNRCNQTRWIELHHKTPVSLGGKNQMDNLATLCTIHHDWLHTRH